MDVLAQRWQLGMGADHVLAHVLRMWTRVADPLEPVDRIEMRQQLRERKAVLAREVAAVGVDVLSEQRDLLDAVGGEAGGLRNQLARRTTYLTTTSTRHYAIRTNTVAADADLHPSLIVTGALGRKIAGEAFELEEALRGQRVARQELRQLVHLAGAERDVDEGKPREHLVLDRLRPAAADADDPGWILGLQTLGVPEVRDEAIIRLLTDRARVEQDQVRAVLRLGLGVAEGFEHSLHAFGVVLVHLTAERGDVVTLHLAGQG